MSASEQILIQRAQKGDHDAFAALVDEHQRYVYNLALRVLKDENEALDLTQETFVRAWRALPNFKGQSQFSTWLYRIVTNLCYNRLPSLRRSLNDLGDDLMEDIPAADSAFGNPVRGLESKEARSYLYEALGGLDGNYRLLITLRYQNEMSYEEIASTLNLPLGTVKTGIFRAKQQLRRSLAKLEEIMDIRLTHEQENSLLEDALENYPLAPMPRSVTASVLARIQQDVRPALITWGDFAFSLVFASCVGAVLFAAQSLPSIALAKLHVQGILLYQDILFDVRRHLLALATASAASLAGFTLYQLSSLQRK